MSKVSVLILAKNEEKFIGACIKSVKDFAGEVIVIDDFSTDKTAQIAKDLGARVIQRGLNGDWGGQQTFAIKQAKFDWIFFIDADERATPELSAAIKKVLAADDKNFAWRTPRLSYFWGQLRYWLCSPANSSHLRGKRFFRVGVSRSLSVSRLESLF